MSLLSRLLLLSLIASLCGCSLLFMLANRDEGECDEKTHTNQCDGDLSVICLRGALVRISCPADSGCNEDTGECVQRCGDGFIQVDNGEECDPPGEESEEGTCNFACRFIPVCGDGIVSPGDAPLAPTEQCDDGNIVDGDGCDSSCQVETIEESEPNDDGTPNVFGGKEGNDFDINNAQGPFSQDVLIQGDFRVLGDEDVFSALNNTNQSLQVRIDVALTLHRRCSSNILLLIRGADGALIEVAEDRSATDLCPGITLTLAPNELRFLHLLIFNDSSSEGDYFLQIDFDKGDLICGDNQLDINEECLHPGELCDEECQHRGLCGDNFIDPGEGCDDGNLTDGDGCESDCIPTDALSEIEPNEQDNPQGPLQGDLLLVGQNSFDDLDFFLIENSSNVPQTVRVDLFDPADGLGQPCRSPGGSVALFTTDLQLLDRSQSRLTGEALFEIGRLDLCGGITFELEPGGVRLLQPEKSFLSATNYLLQLKFTTCGDGELEAGEECETPGANGCDAQCQRVASCGDSVIDFPEEHCDDGNTNNGDDCPADCRLVSGAIDEIEFNGDLFSFNDVLADPPAFIQQSFDSDALILGTLDSRDTDFYLVTNNTATTATIAVEIFSLRDGIDQPCTRLRASAEGTFEGIPINNGTCRGRLFTVPANQSVLVSVESLFGSLELPYLLSVDFVACGNGDVDFGEECDPPNTPSCDTQCQRIAVCGDGLLDLPEQCDDGNVLDGDACPSDCDALQSLFESEPNEDGSPSVTLGLNGGDFSIINADGPIQQDALVFAQIAPLGDEDVFAITNVGSSPARLELETFNGLLGVGVSCGGPASGGIDPVLSVREATGTLIVQNDDKIDQVDRCSRVSLSVAPGQSVFAHVLEFNEDSQIQSYILFAKFTPLICGDGIKEPEEPCDDGNLLDGDGCSSTCQPENVGFDCLPGQTLLQLSATDVPINIPDGDLTGVVSLINVADNRSIKRVVVGIDELTHPFDGDLKLSLASPTGIEIVLTDNHGGSGDNYIDTVFDDGCVVVDGSVADGAAPFTGCFSPDQSLASLVDQSANGPWSLKVIDRFSGDIGTLNGWTLGLCVQ